MRENKFRWCSQVMRRGDTEVMIVAMEIHVEGKRGRGSRRRDESTE